MIKNGWTYELVKIADLIPGAPFYRSNPIESNLAAGPDYNTPGLQDKPDSLVWICYPTCQEPQHPYTK